MLEKYCHGTTKSGSNPCDIGPIRSKKKKVSKFGDEANARMPNSENHNLLIPG